MFFTYALYSRKYNKIYIGFTSDIEQRLIAHNDPMNKGFTGKFQPWCLIYIENHEDKGSAMKREKELKTAKGREFIRSLIR